ncbi:MAG: hypothetical protein IJV34_08255 [Prevotella sp.]|nr:hypothetical protein [Prevotella sp.]
MKKMLTLMLSAAMMLTANAQNAGDYVYTDNGRFKITTGENLLTNGDFDNGSNGWTTDGGNTLSPDTFAIETENENNYLSVYSKDNGPGTGSSLLRSLAVESGKCYVINYQVKGNDDAVSTTVTSGANAKNYQNFLFSTSGSVFDEENVSIGSEQTYGFNWTTIQYAYQPNTDGYLLLHFYAPYIGTCFDNFQVMEATEVVDDRAAAKIFALLNSYLQNPLFPNGHDILESVIMVLQECVDNDDIDGYREYSNYVDEAISEFLNMNTTDVISFVANGTFDDLKTTSANQTSAGAWAIDDGLRVENPTGKTRWAVKSAAETGAPFTGNYLQNDIPYGSKNKLYEATVHQTIENMPAAQYMFTIKTRGYKFTSKTAKTTEIRGMKVFINNDSTECYPVEEENATRFTVYSTLAEAGNMKIGFYLPDAVANHVDLDVVDLRIIGWTQDEVDEFFYGKELAEARQNLRHSVDSARTLHADPLMLYGKVRLDSAIIASQNYLQTYNLIDSLNDSRTRLNKEITRYIGSNGALTNLHKAIANAEELAADDSYAEADRNNLRQAIETAKAYLATLSAENHEEEGYTDADTNLKRSLNTAYGLTVNYTSKNKTVMALLNLEEGDMVSIDWAMANNSHSMMIVSANAKVLLADGTWQEYTKTGKDNANVLPKWNNDGLSGSTRSTLLMTANGTLDFYQSSTNSTMQIYYLGITKAENVTLGVRNMETATQRLSNGSIYDLSGRKVSGTKPGLYIRDGKKFIVK